jgi:S-methylmethionine-dependent homocysteine/selenocysteine methylase
MARYRDTLPQLGGDLFLTDGGMETTLIFHDGLELPDFAAFVLLKDPEGKAALRNYYRTYAELAKQFNAGLVLDTATWRASADWGARLGYSSEELAEANRHAVRLLEDTRREYETEQTKIVINGCIGPRGDGYTPDQLMTIEQAADYHRVQLETFAQTAADMVSALTMNYAEEAIGITQAAQQAGMPVVISFTVETDGRLPTGQGLGEAIEAVEQATSRYPSYYMINCAHPTHFAHVLRAGERFVQRIHGLRANASRMSHVELNEAPELDIGNPAELGMQYAELKRQVRQLNVLGGCCGTDHRHIGQIAEACVPLFRTSPERPALGESR